MEEEIKIITRKLEEAELVLVGIGEKFARAERGEVALAAYRGLARLLDGKNYFIITVCTDKLIYDAGLKEERIVCPLVREESDLEGEKPGLESGAEGNWKTARISGWDSYMKWLQGTLHRKLFVLELGVGLKYPAVIRFPFEKIVYFNRRADFVRVHETLYQLPAELKDKGVSMKEDAMELMAAVSGSGGVYGFE